MTSAYLDRPLRPEWITRKAHDRSGGFTRTWDDVSLIVIYGARISSDADSSSVTLSRNGKLALPSDIMAGAGRWTDAYFENYGAGPVADFMPDKMIEWLIRTFNHYLSKGATP